MMFSRFCDLLIDRSDALLLFFFRKLQGHRVVATGGKALEDTVAVLLEDSSVLLVSDDRRSNQEA